MIKRDEIKPGKFKMFKIKREKLIDMLKSFKKDVLKSARLRQNPPKEEEQ